MSRFYGSMKGGRGQVTRCGTKGSGIQSHVRGWNIGVKITCYANVSDEDEVAIYLTSGSNDSKASKLLGIFKKEDLGKHWKKMAL